MSSESGISIAEADFCHELRIQMADCAVGEFIPDSEAVRPLLSAIEFFVPEILSAVHSEWRSESIDGVLSYQMRKTGCLEFEIKAVVILLSSQCLAPLCLQAQIASDRDVVSWLDLRFGQNDGGRLAEIPYRSSAKLFHALCEQAVECWHSHVSFGQHGS
jgi:hypothetical protein